MTAHLRPTHACRTTRPASWPGRGARGRAALLLTAVSTLSGCYTQVPVQGTPAPGTTLQLDLNDRGRVALGDSIGTSAARIEGEVAASSDSSYVLRVSQVRYLNGQANRWSGEPLTVRADLVGRAQERRFSRSRTLAVGLGIAAALVAVAVSADLIGGGSPVPGGGTGGPIGQQ